MKCLHDHFLNLNTYSLGIGNFHTPSARSELKCIQDSSNDQSLYTSFSSNCIKEVKARGACRSHHMQSIHALMQMALYIQTDRSSRLIVSSELVTITRILYCLVRTINYNYNS